jgi:signal transduction histidine kinase
VSLVAKYGELDEKEKQNKHITRIKSSINDLTEILNDFLSVSKLEEGRVECSPESFNIREFTSSVIAEMQTLSKQDQQIKYIHTGEENVYLDKKLLKNILFNLISNALKFSPEGKPVDVETDFTKPRVKIQVKDHGIGISDEDQEHLFERFFRGRNATHVQGTGLGLSIVAKYVELMNGSINFESKEKKGSVFSIRFPQ